MNRNTQGFTILELIIVLVISTVLAGIITLSFSRVQGQLGVQSAQTNFLSLHAQARAFAAERGTLVYFVVDDGDDEFRVEWDNPDTGTREVLNVVSVGQEFGVNVTASESGAQLCFTPRGIADPGCNTFTGTLRVQLDRANRSAALLVLQLGQAREA